MHVSDYLNLSLTSTQAASVDLVVQVVTIAESIRLQSVLATYGIQTQTPNEIEPVQIWPQSEMVKVFEKLGRNEMLGLSGRPARPIGSLGSSKVKIISIAPFFSAGRLYIFSSSFTACVAKLCCATL